MPRWSSSSWMTSPPLYPGLLGGSPQEPIISMISPEPGAGNVAPDAPIRIVAFAPDGAPMYVQLLVNGDMAWDGEGFVNGYRGVAQSFGNRFVLECVHAVTGNPHSRNVWPDGSTVSISASAHTNAGRHSYYEGAFTVRPDSTVYRGNGLLPLEAALLRPMQVFLELEPLRQLLLKHALRDELYEIENRAEIAARALYQIAFDTEISTVLNPYASKDAAACKIRVLQKRPTLELDRVLQNYDGMIDTGLESLITHGALPREYRNSLADDRRSMLYLYRVAAPVVAVFLARAVEEYVAAGTTPTGYPTGMHGFGDSFPFTLGG